MAAIAGLRGTGDFGTDERPKNFREMILFMNPNGAAPIFALTAKAKKKTVDDPEFAWWNETNVLIRLQVNNSSNYGTTETTIVVDSADPSSSNLSLNWGNATHLKAGDILMVEPASDSATFSMEQLIVTSVNSATSFNCVRGANGSS